ncbi:DEAD/DEAH box helicase family protein [Campylobacter sp.]|uniref:DEAD/DEAH box helicase family protein n=1 Tax=Campylobacter sp. TaxID=205 RepID=UPI002AA80975|nr:DEAD/DEAH box helicase family protein [Campylobacter sp.]MCI6564026.1 DEAD/DEAH box helicase family protein [Campylobacter sp.]
MAKTIYNEKIQYQADIIKEFAKNGVVERDAKYYDKNLAMDKEILIEFLKSTQEKELNSLGLKGDEIISKINDYIIKNGILECLKNGVMINNTNLELVYNKESSGFNADLAQKYEKNKITIIQEVNADNENKERVDLVVFVNGVAFACMELKSNYSGQDYKDAIKQYKEDRNPQNRLFDNRLGAIVFFALDLYECYMTTKLEKSKTKFLAFNKGKGSGSETGAGNDEIEDKISNVWYLWEEVLVKDNIIDLIKNFIFDDKGVMIFPRYHQMDLVHKVKSDILKNSEYKNYLIQHSAGSGKTKSIAWLAYMLASLYKNGSVRYESVIIVTDRIVVDRQLQNEINKIKHQEGFIKALGDENSSKDLKDAIKNSVKIIISTIQKFSYIKDELKNFDTKCAVIIDEAHSSTSGSNMEALIDTLSAEFSAENKPKNISLFGFTATPKKSTLQIFGKEIDGMFAPFHLYSMKQAIEEGYILNVLDNYTTYNTLYNIVLNSSDKEVEQNQAKRKIRDIIKHNTDIIKSRVAVIAEHFASSGKDMLNNKAKAMVVCEDIESVIRYYQAFCEYCAGRYDFKPLIAFSGQKEVAGVEYSESGINGISEASLPSEFNKDERRVLFVANKYQTGFDQNKLCIMYVIKALSGITAVQTLSRLNRICPEFPHKTTFVLDFVNKFDDIIGSFAPHYTQTMLKDGIDMADLLDINAKIDGYNILMRLEEKIVADATSNIDDNTQKMIRPYFTKAITQINNLDDKHKVEFKGLLTNYKNIFLHLKIIFGDTFSDKLNNRYTFIEILLKQLTNENISNENIDIGVINVQVLKNQTHTKDNIKPDPVMEMSAFGSMKIDSSKLEMLSIIIKKINDNLSLNIEENSQIKAIINISEKLLNSSKLQSGAKNNNKNDFTKLYNDELNDILTDNYNDAQFGALYGQLLNNQAYINEIFTPLQDNIYDILEKR